MTNTNDESDSFAYTKLLQAIKHDSEYDCERIWEILEKYQFKDQRTKNEGQKTLEKS